MRNGLLNEIDIEDFVRGTTLMGTGGGGNPLLGAQRLLDVLKNNFAIEWVNPAEIRDEAMTCCVFGMGSIAPGECQIGAYDLSVRETLRPNVRAVRELEKLAGVRIEAIVPFELGGNNTAVAVNTAMMMGLKVPDGDYSGRAVPELSQVKPAVFGKTVTPLVICDEWGNVVHVVKTPNNKAAEGIGKMISMVTKAPDMLTLCAHAGFLMRGKEMKKYLITGTLSKALRIGQAIREARECGGDALQAVTRMVEGRVIFTGIVREKKFVSNNGYMIGETLLQGTGDFINKECKIWLKNENHMAWVNGRITAMSPDLIEIVKKGTAEPITNTDLAPGDEVGVLGIPHIEYRNKECLALMGPKYFGFDCEYQKIEDLAVGRE